MPMTPTQLGEVILEFISRLEDAETELWDEMAFVEGHLHLTVPFCDGKWAIIITRPDEMDTVQ